MDLIILRLVQAAMLRVTLEGIHAAQQQHLDANAPREPFSMANWSRLIFSVMPRHASVPERAFGQTSIEPILNSVFSKGAQTFAQLTDLSPTLQIKDGLSHHRWYLHPVCSGLLLQAVEAVPGGL